MNGETKKVYKIVLTGGKNDQKLDYIYFVVPNYCVQLTLMRYCGGYVSLSGHLQPRFQMYTVFFLKSPPTLFHLGDYLDMGCKV